MSALVTIGLASVVIAAGSTLYGLTRHAERLARTRIKLAEELGVGRERSRCARIVRANAKLLREFDVRETYRHALEDLASMAVSDIEDGADPDDLVVRVAPDAAVAQ